MEGESVFQKLLEKNRNVVNKARLNQCLYEVSGSYKEALFDTEGLSKEERLKVLKHYESYLLQESLDRKTVTFEFEEEPAFSKEEVLKQVSKMTKHSSKSTKRKLNHIANAGNSEELVPRQIYQKRPTKSGRPDNASIDGVNINDTPPYSAFISRPFMRRKHMKKLGLIEHANFFNCLSDEDKAALDNFTFEKATLSCPIKKVSNASKLRSNSALPSTNEQTEKLASDFNKRPKSAEPAVPLYWHTKKYLQKVSRRKKYEKLQYVDIEAMGFTF
uniref:Uncharacterized protein n=1 Tax=Panagrellus redivivus TaxID=6233 RepID=A0A7E4W9D4_PANRE